MERIGVIYPGQGSQYVGMGKKLFDKYPIARLTFEEASDTLNMDIERLCFEGDINRLTQTANTQPAILTASVAAFRAYMEEMGVEPECSAGHSLGEYSALVGAGAINFSDALRIVRKRGILMQEAVASYEGAMMAVLDLDTARIEEECKKNSSNNSIAVISNYNSPRQVVISGHKAAVYKASEALKAMGGKVIPLKVSAPFHSPLMFEAAEGLRSELERYSYKELKYPVISNITSKPYIDKDDIIENLTQQMIKPVRWHTTMEYIINQGINIAIEMGPQSVLKNLSYKNGPHIKVLSYDDEKDVESLRSVFYKRKQANSFSHTVITKSIAIAVCTKNHNNNNDEYLEGVVEPYNKLKEMQDKLDREGKQPTYTQMVEALNILKMIFETKKTPIEERKERFKEIFDATATQGMFFEFISNVEKQ